MTKAPVNRIKHYIGTAQASTQQQAVEYGHVVQCALQTMARLMASFDNDVAFQAASAVLEIEKARLRHKMPLAGLQPVQPTQTIEADEQPQQLTETQSQQFEKAVDEFTVVLNKKQVSDGEPPFPRAVLREHYKKKLIEVGFDEFLCWHEWMVGRREVSPVTTSTSART
jgi:hypothetical protein